MKKKVTYAIGYIRQSPFAQELKELKLRYETEVELGNANKASTLALGLSDLLIAQVDEIDPDLPDHVQEEDTRKYLERAIYYSKKAISMLQKKKESHFQHDLVSAYYNLCQCQLSLQDFTSAIRYGLVAASYMPADNCDKHKLQSIYKSVADAYFIKGIDPHVSRYNDFLHAFEYYQKEKALIDIMTLDDVDRDPTILPQLNRSSNFNLGVVCSKMMAKDKIVMAEGFLRQAIEQAQKLQDLANEKRTWWELGNHFRRTSQDSFVKGCQVKEMNIIRHHGFKDDEPPCLEERIKFHLEFEEFQESHRLCKRYKELLILEYREYYEAIYDLIVESEQLISRYKEKSQSNINTLNSTIEKVALLQELTVIQMDNQMLRAAVKSADRGLQDLKHCYNSSSQTAILYLELLELKLDALWQLRESNIETYININNQSLEFIETHIRNPKEKLEQKRDMYKQRTLIHTYFNQETRSNHFKELWMEANAKCEKQSASKDNIQADISNKSQLDFGTRITPSHKALLNMNSSIIQVCVLLPEPLNIHITCYDTGLSINWLIEEIKTKTWQIHGYEPIISQLQSEDSDIMHSDSIGDVIFQQNQIVKAITTGTVLKSILEIYLNACERSNIEPSPSIRRSFSNVEHGKVPLKGLLSTEQIPIIKQVLERVNLINELDLSYNYLSNVYRKKKKQSYLPITDTGNKDLKTLLTSSKTPNEINLGNNELDITGVKCLIEVFKNSDIARISLAFNPIGPQLVEEIPNMISAFPNLRMLNLESTALGGQTTVSEELKKLYQAMSLSDIPYLITINLSGNHFQHNMLSIWTSLLSSIKRLDKLHLTGITSDTKWNDFMSFSETSLRGIDCSFSSEKILDMDNIQQLLSSGKRLTELDLSGYGLTAADVTCLCQGSQYQSNFKHLSLDHNDIGDHGLKALYDKFKLCKIKQLNLSFCGLTSESTYVIAQWGLSGLVEEMNITGNDIFATEQELEHFFDLYSLGEAKISLDLENHLEDKTLPRMIQRQVKQLVTPF
ncbi:hypothetical protein BY458DRAFT_550844 [Sporodiniella umbellata]|nr:hypothetical protein BY458DRAFT_550844 [Sporodiniella umbellata]